VIQIPRRAMQTANRQVEEEEQCGPMLIEKLEGGGVNNQDIKKLKEHGFQTVESIAFATKKTVWSVALIVSKS
jgi:DNA repair protein RAD51